MEERYLQYWTKIKYFLEQTVGEKTFTELFEQISELVKVENNTMYVLAPSNFIKNRIEKLFSNKINEYLSTIQNEDLRIKFITQEEYQSEQDRLTKTLVQKDLEAVRGGNLNATYTFSNFVTGKNNRLASTIAMQVADQPGVFANPLYIFGSVGIGKTHLMQAIGNYIIDNNHTKTVLYVKTENFVEDYVNSLHANNIERFNDKYRDIDVLLVDDIQFLSKKPQSQQQFFKLFENLHQDNKQIVITSDRPTSELKEVMARLTSRFSWGVVADINPPDLEHRLEILKKKLKTHNIEEQEVPMEVLELIANSFTDSVRELEGALTRVIFYRTFMDEELTEETTMEALKPLLKSKDVSKKLTKSNNADKLLEVVSGYFNITKTDLLGRSRKRQYVYPRQVAMFLMRDLYDMQYKKIGIFFGGKDHSTVMNAFDKIQVGIKREENIKNDVNNIRIKVDNLS